MNKTTILAISAVFAVSMIAITAFEAEAKPPTQSVACPAENVQHWHSVNFVFGEANTQLVHDTLPTIDQNKQYWIQIQSTEFDVIHFQTAITDRLNEIGYRQLIVDTGQELPLPQRIILAVYAYQNSVV